MAATPENHQFDRALVDAVRELPILWQTCKKTNVNKNAKNNAWIVISDMLKPHSGLLNCHILFNIGSFH